MEIVKTCSGKTATFSLNGRLDATTSPLLEEQIKAAYDGITELILDFEKVAYISSAGLRVLLSAQKEMNKRGSMIVKNVCEDIREVFDITGFADILTVE